MSELPYTIDELREACNAGNIKWSLHIWKRMRERNIRRADFKNCIYTGEIIEEYSDDRPTPSCLIAGQDTAEKPLHDVVGYSDMFLSAITTYFPDKNEWEDDFKTRRVN